MLLNIGTYLEKVIKASNYTKKELCEEINKRYDINNKPISYTTFSNNIKEGNISFNEAIALATIIDIDLNKIVNTYKKRYNQIFRQENNIEMKRLIVNILNNETLVKGITYKVENVFEIDDDEFECLYVSEDGNTAIMQTVMLDDYIINSCDVGCIVEKAYFTNFLNVLDDNNMTLKDFNDMPLNERFDFLSKEGNTYLTILGE